MSHRMKRRAVILSLIFALLVLSGCQQASQSLLLPGVQPGTQPTTKTYEYKDKLITALNEGVKDTGGIKFVDDPSLDTKAAAALQYFKTASGENISELEKLLAEDDDNDGLACCALALKTQLSLDPSANYSVSYAPLSEAALAGDLSQTARTLLDNNAIFDWTNPEQSTTERVGAATDTIGGNPYIVIIRAF